MLLTISLVTGCRVKTRPRKPVSRKFSISITVWITVPPVTSSRYKVYLMTLAVLSHVNSFSACQVEWGSPGVESRALSRILEFTFQWLNNKPWWIKCNQSKLLWFLFSLFKDFYKSCRVHFQIIDCDKCILSWYQRSWLKTSSSSWCQF